MFRHAVSYLAASALLTANIFNVGAAKDPTAVLKKAIHEKMSEEMSSPKQVRTNQGTQQQAPAEFWTQVGRPMNGDQDFALFGYSVDQSADGQYIAVSSADWYDEGTDTPGVGKVQVYQREIKKSGRVTWIERGQPIIGKFKNHNLGNTVKLSDDGRVLAVGSDETRDDTGHIDVYTYSKRKMMWRKLGARLKGSMPDAEFGWAFDLTPDGKTIVCGSPEYGDDAAGRTEVYKYNAETKEWDMKGQPIIGYHWTGGDDAYYGWSVGIDAFGDRIVTSGPYDALDHNYTWPGAIRTYDYDHDSGDWILAGGALTGWENGDEFGISVAMSKDGSTLAVGAGCYYYCEDHYGDYVTTFGWNITKGDWDFLGDIYPEWGDVGFGNSINLSNDGTKLGLATAGQEYGYARVFELDYGNMTWNKVGQDLLIPKFDYGHSAHHVSLSGNGTQLAVGAILSRGGGYRSGQVRAYELATDEATSKVAGCKDAHREITIYELDGQEINCIFVRNNKHLCNDTYLGDYFASICPLACGKCFDNACDDPLYFEEDCQNFFGLDPEDLCGNPIGLTLCRKTCYSPMYDTLCPDKPLPPYNGEEVCEGHGYNQTTCEAIGDSCCHWDNYDGECWSSIGTDVCTGLDNHGEEVCQGHGYNQTTCEAIGDSCCHWNDYDGECWSSIGRDVCTGLDNHGEEVCEGHGYNQTTCEAIGDSCCHWDDYDGECYSSIGRDVCTGL